MYICIYALASWSRPTHCLHHCTHIKHCHIASFALPWQTDTCIHQWHTNTETKADKCFSSVHSYEAFVRFKCHLNCDNENTFFLYMYWNPTVKNVQRDHQPTPLCPQFKKKTVLQCIKQKTSFVKQARTWRRNSKCPVRILLKHYFKHWNDTKNEGDQLQKSKVEQKEKYLKCKKIA